MADSHRLPDSPAEAGTGSEVNVAWIGFDRQRKRFGGLARNELMR
jgi:hypothetical protein